MKLFYKLFLIIFLSVSGFAFAQQHPNSPVYKDYKSEDTSTIFKRVDDSFKLWQSYLLIKEANNGNAFAQHELGLRYLTGKGFPADTVKGFYWIKKASEGNVTAASYNLGILYYNGWGTDWNPFEAYKLFKKAANDNMPEAQFIIGLTYIDNLIIPRNLEKAYYYLKKADSRGYKPAKDILKEFNKKEYFFVSDSLQLNESTQAELPDSSDLVQPAAGIVYINPIDSVQQNDDASLVRELLKSGVVDLQKAFGIKTLSDSSFQADSSAIIIIKKAAEDGSPEAIALLGRCYEKGIGVSKNIISAAAQYIRAIRLDSPRGRKLMMDLLNENASFQKLLTTKYQANDPEGEFVMAGMTALEFNQQLLKGEAFKLLKSSAENNFMPSIIELGYCYFTGNLTKQDKGKAIETWRKASTEKNLEVKVRIAIANIQDGFIYEPDTISIKILKEASEKGNVLAEVALAYCYETGKGVTADMTEAVSYYRDAARRGSQGAYNALVRMYDEIRPNDDEFLIIN